MGVVTQPFSDVVVVMVRHFEMEVLWMEVRILGICHPDYQDNPVLHYHDYCLSHLVTRFQKEGLEMLSHCQMFHEECDLLDLEFHQDLFLPGFSPWTVWEYSFVKGSHSSSEYCATWSHKFPSLNACFISNVCHKH